MQPGLQNPNQQNWTEIKENNFLRTPKEIYRQFQGKFGIEFVHQGRLQGRSPMVP